jgi:cobalt-zinc-cadmium efflux system outer membrane protein
MLHHHTLIVLAAAWTVASSQVMAAESLTLREAVETALTVNPQLRAAERQIEAARARETQANALPNPNLTLIVDQVPVPDPIDGNYMAGITQPLLLGGQREARTELARIETQIAELDREVYRQELAAKVKTAYAEVLHDLAGISLAQVGYDRAAATLRGFQARYKAGEVARVEVLRAEVEAGQQIREMGIARNRAQQAKAQLNVLMGRAADSPLTLEDLPAPQVAFPALAEVTRDALEKRVELRRAGLSIEREALQRQLAQSGQWTGTEVMGAVGMVGGRPGFSTTLTIPMPFYRQQGEIAEAEANKARAEAERDALRNDITLEVEAAYRDGAIAANQVNMFLRIYVPQAQRFVANAEERLKAGEGTGVEVSDARRALIETQAEYQRALLAYRQALTRLERAIGRDVAQP